MRITNALSYYHDVGVRDICKAVKKNDVNAIDIIAKYIIEGRMVSDDSILIPVPQHYGFATYTKTICDKVALETGCKVADILRCIPHESIYQQKLYGKQPSIIYYINGIIPQGKLFFVDNVISTGLSFYKANQLFGHSLTPLVYAVDETRVQL